MVDKRMWVVLVLVLLCGTVWAQNEVAFAAYDAWITAPRDLRAAFVNGIYAGAYFVAMSYMLEHPGEGLPPIDQWVPTGISVGELMNLIDTVYQTSSNRQIATAAIVCNWRKYRMMYWGY